jgi:hypothetical protein
VELTHPEPRLTCIADRTQKLKDARSEAAKEIEELKSKKEEEFQKYKKDVSAIGDGDVLLAVELPCFDSSASSCHSPQGTSS